ncbi:MAG TPA: hypothetical protein VM432_13940 [Bdellovibrionales bacterium]|nr:hypothetical protein [Bdellovibrionales bacterium]
MPRGSKSAYSSKQKRMARHIEEGYEKRGVGTKEAARRAWSTVNAETGGAGKRITNKRPSRKGGRIGGRSVSHATRVAAGKKAAKTRARRASH